MVKNLKNLGQIGGYWGLNIPSAHRQSSAKPVVKVAGAQYPITDMKGKGKVPDTVRKSLKWAAVSDLVLAGPVRSGLFSKLEATGNRNRSFLYQSQPNRNWT